MEHKHRWGLVRGKPHICLDCNTKYIEGITS